jgi:diacylglycerol O-acyltransferase / wax synthase
LRMGDRVLLDLFPMVPLGGNLKLGVAILSYNGKISFGLVADFDAMPDLEQLAGDFEDAMGELEEAAGIHSPSTPQTRPVRQDPALTS